MLFFVKGLNMLDSNALLIRPGELSSPVRVEPVETLRQAQGERFIFLRAGAIRGVLAFGWKGFHRLPNHSVVAALLAVLLSLAAPVHAADKPLQTRAQALQALHDASAEARFSAISRLAEIGTMPDADREAERLHDAHPQVRELAASALWQIWGRSGDKAIDAKYQKGTAQIGASQLKEALATFDDIVRTKPAFAEGWNKRATVYFMLGEFEKSLKDCDEVMKRNPKHFGALSGYGQIHLQLGDYDRAIAYFERALKVNPNLPGTAEMIDQLRDKLEEKRRKTV